MKTYILFFTKLDKQKLQKKEISTIFNCIPSEVENVLIINYGEKTESALIKCMEIQKDLFVQDSNEDLRIVLFCSETKPEKNLLRILDKLIVELDILISLNHIAFAQLQNHNHFNFRFIGVFPADNSGESHSLFDFIVDFADELTLHKIESKSVFEDSVFNFYSKRVPQAMAGFHNVLKLCPEDRASMEYIEWSKEILSLD